MTMSFEREKNRILPAVAKSTVRFLNRIKPIEPQTFTGFDHESQ